MQSTATDTKTRCVHCGNDDVQRLNGLCANCRRVGHTEDAWTCPRCAFTGLPAITQGVVTHEA